ncbi:MAG: hypothetical protein VX166_07825 [Pseudomonadota bacterium]|nr:hypothetical protein [Pseudomonadota bacterium]
MNGKQPINGGRIRVSSLRLFIVSQHRALSGVLERSVLAGFLSKFDPPQISSLILSRRVRKACGWPLMVLSACSSSLPANTGDVCSISAERNSWYRAARAAEERWQAPKALNMAIICQESSFWSRARPERERFLWGFPGARPPSVFGYAQALESTSQEYRQQSGNVSASRSDFADALNYIALYNANPLRVSGIESTDSRAFCCAYYEGNASFQHGSHLRKHWLNQAADQVQQSSEKFSRQLDMCRSEFEKSWFEKLLSSASDQIGWEPAIRSIS